jgi:hypothetical protein
LQAALCGAPSAYACCRFAKKLRANRPAEFLPSLVDPLLDDVIDECRPGDRCLVLCSWHPFATSEEALVSAGRSVCTEVDRVLEYPERVIDGGIDLDAELEQTLKDVFEVIDGKGCGGACAGINDPVVVPL